MWASRHAEIIFDLADIAEEMGAPVGEGNLMSMTLAELRIGDAPIGQVELLDFQDRVEKKFNIRFQEDEIPEPSKAQKLTLEQIATIVEKKENRK